MIFQVDSVKKRFGEGTSCNHTTERRAEGGRRETEKENLALRSNRRVSFAVGKCQMEKTAGREKKMHLQSVQS